MRYCAVICITLLALVIGYPAAAQLTGQNAARQCAQNAGKDIEVFASCMSGQLVLPKSALAIINCVGRRSGAVEDEKEAVAECLSERTIGQELTIQQRAIVSCAKKSRGDRDDFRKCMSRRFTHFRLSKVQQNIVYCARPAGGDDVYFAACAGEILMREHLSTAEAKTLSCAALSGGSETTFTRCLGQGINITDDQKRMVRCARIRRDAYNIVECAAAAMLGDDLSDEQRVALRCAAESDGDFDEFAGCMTDKYHLTDAVTPETRKVIRCAKQDVSAAAFAVCAGTALLGDDLSRDQKAALECATRSGGTASGFASCIGTKLLAFNVNPEQQIALECVAQTSGQPYAAAGCTGARLLQRELEKCVQSGWGGDGCFGDSNDLVGRNGWFASRMREISGGPNSVIHNPGQIFGGPNSIFNNPGQITGGPNSVINNPGQITGGPNSIINNPGQITGGPNSFVNNPDLNPFD